jgi:site-specific DNA recombinase
MGMNEPKTVGTKQIFDVFARLSYAENGETVNVDEQVEMGCEAIERRGAVVGQAFRDNS